MVDGGRVLRAIEGAVARSVGADRTVAVAWSGGLASTLVATVARKQAEIRCYAVVAAGSATIRALEARAWVLDLKVQFLAGGHATAEQAIERVRHAATERRVLTGERRRSTAAARGVSRPLRVEAVYRETRGRRAGIEAAARLAGLPDEVTSEQAAERGPVR